ncbi:hypothetical protein [Rhodococcus wratislaviensis]|uniref:Uncharacterized protein n=1 Tax=Rhodococcus wratislaviensis NBRC 100605 TaxID=1219028 RepID=X0PXW3_RHOWR|nr:hypothetical protein [Rhodococcus wratislaviensis]GAF48268.1 hypothetical protein RW1_051_00320 [Rhodococcus wratislaviensis NBRC 100605]
MRNQIDDALDSIRSAGCMFDVALALLRLCRANRSELQEAVRSRFRNDEITQLSKSFALLVGKLGTRSGRSECIEILAEDETAALTARAILITIENDETAWREMATDFRELASNPIRIEIGTETPFVFPLPPLKRLYEPCESDSYAKTHFSTRPLSAPNSYSLDSISSVSLGLEGPAPIQVVLDLQAGEALDSAMAEARAPLLAAAHPARKLSEFSIPNQTMGNFFPTTIKNNDAAINTEIINLLRRVNDIGVPICASPELACVESTKDVVLKSDPNMIPPVVHLGSAHVDSNGDQFNRAYLLFPRYALSVEQDKLSRYTFAPGTELACPESINLGNELRICWGKNWSLAMLTCADFLDKEVRRLLSHFRPSIIVVGAMSPKTDMFRGCVAHAVAESQSHAIIVNGPRDWQDNVIFGIPVTGYDDISVETMIHANCSLPDSAVAHVGRGSGDIVWTPVR